MHHRLLSLISTVIFFTAFADVAIGQDIQRLSSMLSGQRAFGDESGLEVGPRRYLFEGGSAVGASSDVSFPYDTTRSGIVPGGFERDYSSRVDGVENLGSSDNVPYGRSKLSRRKTIVILIRRRRPRWQGGSGFEDGGGRWGSSDYDHYLGDPSTSQKRRARRALLRILLSKLLLAAARGSLAREESDEDEGRDSRSEQRWSLSEQGSRPGWRFGGGSDFGSAESYDGSGSRWTREGLGGEGGRVLLRIIRPNTPESNGIFLVGNGRGPQSVARWFPSENIGETSGSAPAVSNEESASLSDTTSSDPGFGVVRNGVSISPGPQGHLFTALPSFLRGRLAGSRGFEGTRVSVAAQPSTWPGPNSFQQLPSQAAYGNGDSSYGGMGSNYYPVFRPRLMFRLPQPFTLISQTGIPGTNYDGSSGGLPDTAGSTPFNIRFIPASGGIYGGNPITSSESNGPNSVSNAAYESSPNVNGPLSQKS
uniref:Putative conserved secreted protein n=1 Tax=Rhipicephalus microplus TaxID=6941 RepID=A0A6G5A3J5_RHIMP